MTQKVKTELLYDLVIPTTGYIPKGSKSSMLSVICSPLLKAALFTRAKKSQSRYLLTDEYTYI